MTTRPEGRPPTLIMLLAAPALLLMLLSACVPPPLVLAAATVTAVDVSHDRRTPGNFLDDNVIELKLRTDIKKDETLGRSINVSVTVVNGVVLLTGEVNTDAQRQQVGALAGKYVESHKAKVVNELALAGKTNFYSRINDAWITTKVKARLVKTPHLSATSVKVITEHGKVYLLGLVTRGEADAAVDAIRTINGVTHIVKVFEYIE